MKQLYTANTQPEDASPERIKEFRTIVIPFQRQEEPVTVSLSAIPVTQLGEQWLNPQINLLTIHLGAGEEHGSRSLAERFNETYDEEAKREDEEFVKHVKRYHRRRFSDEW